MSLTDHGRVRKQQFHDRLGILHHRHLHRKLKERFPAAFNTHWTRRHWLHASLFATLGALLATIVPGFSSQLQPASQMHATLPLQLPPLTVRAPGEGAGRLWDVVQVERGQTLGGVFDRMGVPAATMHRILDNPANREALVRLRPGAELAFELDEHGDLRGFRFDRSPTQRVELDLRGEKIHEKVLERATTTRLAVTSAERTPFTPELPTLAEQGIKGFAASNWWGILFPTGVPRPIIDKVAADLARALADKDVKDKLGHLGVEAVSSTPEQFGAFIASENERWGKLIKEAGISGIQ